MKMNKLLVGVLTIGLATSYSVTSSAANGGGKNQAVHQDLQNQIDTIQLTPGPAGDAGADGVDGAEGPAGSDGTNGVAGADGADGVGLDLTGSDGDLLVWEVDNWVANPPEVAVMGVDNMQPFQVINYIIALQGVFPSRNGIEPFIGEIIMFAGNFAPRGWAFCDGQLLPINQNQSLFSILGTTYGGDGRTNFGLPDLRGRAPIHDGFGMGDGLMDRRLGVKGGTETH